MTGWFSKFHQKFGSNSRSEADAFTSSQRVPVTNRISGAVVSALLYPIYSSYPDHKLGYAREGGVTMGWVLLVTVYVAFMSREDANSRQS
jgi:hypothetical protein